MQDGKLSDGRRMLAGFSAGITEALVVVTPFEVVKIRLQQQRGLTKELLRYKVWGRPCCVTRQYLACPVAAPHVGPKL